jgi:hypothetical protein
MGLNGAGVPVAAEESPLFEQIRKNVIVMMTAARSRWA